MGKFKFDKQMQYIISPQGDELEWCYAPRWLNDLAGDLEREEKRCSRAETKIKKLEAKIKRFKG